MDFVVFTTMALSSFASGALITGRGWAWLNMASVVPLVMVAAALLWLIRGQPRRAGAPAA